MLDRLRTKGGFVFDFGFDPEFFVEKDNKLVPSEKLFKGKLLNSQKIEGSNSKLIKDGVAVEINGSPSFCRELLANRINSSFMQNGIRNLYNKGYRITDKSFIKLTKKQMSTLDFDSLNFGCKPSHNVYVGENLSIEQNPEEYPYRAAGGHIHLGYNKSSKTVLNKILQRKKEFIYLLDLLVGNTSVLIDKDKKNKERRQTYGRAGEYRDTKYGIEYRTLSNFWLRGYPLFSLMFGLARTAFLITACSNLKRKVHIKELLSLVNQDDVRRAIDENNPRLAKKNFDKIKDWLINCAPIRGWVSWPQTIKVIEVLYKANLDDYATKDIIMHWTEKFGTFRRGWDSYADKVLKYNHLDVDWTQQDLTKLEKNKKALTSKAA